MPSLLDRAVVGLLPVVPKPAVRYFSKRYIAGPSVQDAIRVVRDLNRQGMMATLDILGEHVTRPEAADDVRPQYLSLLDTIAREKFDSNVSVKLSQLGLLLDPEGCYRRIEEIVRKAESLGNFVRIDMEDSSCTSETLAIFHRLRETHERVGIVIQAMLRRSAADVEKLAASTANVRLCKGIYVEPRAVAYQARETIRASYVQLLDMLLEGGSYVGIATHDEHLVFEALRLIREHRLSPDRYEFQMLLGVEEELRSILVRDGHRLRVYVPFGSEWYAYSVRRLKENPRLAGTIAKSTLLRRG
ncbi:MAG: proline dehydrogenase family protein [Candidatus Eisenbacteria bacterium]